MINKLDDILKQLKGNKRVVLSVAAAHDEEVLLAIKEAVDKEIINPILVGQENKIKEISKKIEFDLDKIKSEGYDLTTPIIVVNGDKYSIEDRKAGKIKTDEKLFNAVCLEV